MSYLALARKYRPQSFSEVAGQHHILQGIINALDKNQLHHAYLFTGTRGVGKTTLARLLAKSINCEQGINAHPCGTCNTCIEISNGTFVDLIEIDAASRTRVEDTRDILDNIQYMPTRGRYKTYIIDEVHMLSTHSFNALLKTLEEPPEHVKFLLATTDPQKLPITVLSRCLQFHLKNLSQREIEQQLSTILEKESIRFEPSALSVISEHADGSMRDALSLLDQALALGNRTLSYHIVNNALGAIETKTITSLAEAIIQQETENAISISHTIINEGKSPKQALNLLAQLWHQIALYQLTQKTRTSVFQESLIEGLALETHPQFIQLLYQITIQSNQEISLAPNSQIGFEMCIMRLLAFLPVSSNATAATKPQKQESTIKPKILTKTTEKHTPHSAPKTQANAPISTPRQSTTTEKHTDWHDIVQKITLKGPAKQLLLNSTLHQPSPNEYNITVSEIFSRLLSDSLKTKIIEELNTTLGNHITVRFNEPTTQIKQVDQLTPAAKQIQDDETQLEETYQKLQNDAGIQALCSAFNTSIEKNNITIKK